LYGTAGTSPGPRLQIGISGAGPQFHGAGKEFIAFIYAAPFAQHRRKTRHGSDRTRVFLSEILLLNGKRPPEKILGVRVPALTLE
jgi:hypothetical protein